nr:hypothetical protein Iba_chr02dCG4350 [Ipomoea batatas]
MGARLAQGLEHRICNAMVIGSQGIIYEKQKLCTGSGIGTGVGSSLPTIPVTETGLKLLMELSRGADEWHSAAQQEGGADAECRMQNRQFEEMVELVLS